MKYRILTSGKINLGLTVIGRLSDGYHEIESIFLPIGVFDSICCEFSIDDKEKVLEVFTSSESLKGEAVPTNSENIVWRVIELVENLVGVKIGFRISLEKNIPVGSGLGGGSGNGAGVLLATVSFLESKGILSATKKSEIFSEVIRIGADIPFFLQSGGCVVRGKGEKIIPIKGLLETLLDYNLVVVYPGFPSCTKDAYDFISKKKLYHPERWALDVATGIAKRSIKLEELKGMLKNTFELFIISPVVKEVKGELYRMGALFSAMSGSGSSVYGIFSKQTDSIGIKKSLVSRFGFSENQIFITRFVENPVQFI
ncbi:MAG: hypothetical protein ABDH28_06675 [Brevinematia bacterium]